MSAELEMMHVDAEIREFYRALYENAGGFVSLCTRKPLPHQSMTVIGFYPTGDIDGLLQAAIAFSGAAHVYHGLHPLREVPRSGRGKKGDVLGVCFFAVDIDAKDFIDNPAERESARKKKDLYGWPPWLLEECKSRAIAKIAEFSLRPSAIVDSGHGCYAYFILKQFWEFKDRIDLQRFEQINRSLHIALGGDSTFDVTRVLRVVGTKNVKPGCPMPCRLVRFDPTIRYSIEDLEGALGVRSIREETSKALALTPARRESQDERPPNLGELQLPGRIRRMIESADCDRDRYPSRSERDLAITRHLVMNGLTDEEIRAVFESYACGDKYREEGSNGAQYLGRTINKARSAQVKERALVVPENFPLRSLGGSDLLVVTEDEAGAAEVCKAGLACIATKGFCEATTTSQYEPIPDTSGITELPAGSDQISIEGREFVLVYDSTIDQAHPAWPAYPALAELLYAHGASGVKVLTLPEVAPAGKTSLHDYVREKGAASFLELVEATPVWVPSGVGAKTWASERVSHAIAQMKVTKSADMAYDQETISALAALKMVDELEYTRAKNALNRTVKVSLRDLSKAVDREIEKTKERQAHRLVNLPKAVREVLPQVPVPAEARVPKGWHIAPEGVFRLLADGPELIAPSPIVISKRLVSMEDHTEKVVLSFRRDGKWLEVTTDRVVIADARRIVELANRGFPVTSGNAREVVAYLADFEAANMDYLAVSQVTHHLGWQGDECDKGFLWGPELIGGHGIVFQGADAGDDQLASGFHSAGTFDAWLGAVKEISCYPRALLCLYTSFVPPMLAILGCPNFVLDLCGRTSRGKTTLLRVAASVWGKPDEQATNGALGTWDSTQVWIERASSVLHSLPLILDDTKRARQDRRVASTLYAVASGRGRARGTRAGLGITGSWHTVLISSGEAPAVTFTDDEGTRARTITLWGSPFGELDESVGKALVDGLVGRIQFSYGHAGPRFVRWIIDHKDVWSEWRRLYGERVQRFARLMSGSAVSGRIASYLAAISVTGKLVHEALNLPWEFKDPAEQVVPDIAAEVDDADMAKRALRDVFAWAEAHETTFRGREQGSDSYAYVGSTHRGWSGRWDSGDRWKFIAFYPHVLKQALSDCGFSPDTDYDAILRTWKDSGYLDTDAKGNRTFKATWMGKDERTTRMIVLKREAIDSVVV